LALDRDPSLFGGLVEGVRAVGRFLQVLCSFRSEAKEADITSHNGIPSILGAESTTQPLYSREKAASFILLTRRPGICSDDR
jgi:hypothetical protein